LGKSLGELNFERTYGAVVTRVTRADVEFAANNQVRLQFGDFLFVVGSNEGVVQVGDLVGNKPKALDQPHVLPVFVGILLGVILGSLPIVLPGMPAPVRLGLARRSPHCCPGAESSRKNRAAYMVPITGR
jgi:putative transport protein